MSSNLEIVLAGFGGQGLLFAGKIIATCGLIEDREVSWLPSYGPEMRGGTANCSVTVADDPIGSPLIVEPNALIAMNQPSFDKFFDLVVPGGVIVVDTTMVQNLKHRDDVRMFELPATQMAEDAGLKGLANVILTGKVFAETDFCDEETLFAAIDACVPARKAALVDKNKEALRLGMSA